jgi:lytic murein transglycosylase
MASAQRTTLAAIEKRFGVPPAALLAIWGRETAFGQARLPYPAVRVLATQAYLGRRKEQFRQELLLLLQMLQRGEIRAADLRSSWAGAMGQPQFLPSDFGRYAVDFDGDGRRDIWHSVPDVLASVAAQLDGKGWRAGHAAAYEVRLPKGADCTLADPDRTMPVADWLRHGYAPAFGRAIPRADLAEPASLFLPAGTFGPAFLTLGNFYVFKAYNFSDLYALFVSHLADRITDPRGFETPWSKVVQLRERDLDAMQRHMAALGLYSGKIDGKAGQKTRLALGAYQKKAGLPLDCWPTAAVLDHMRRQAGGRLQ